jgi:hypothetical protein
VNTVWRVMILLLAPACAGCGGQAPGDLPARLQHEDPAVRIWAIKEAGQSGDPALVPLLVDRLTDSERDVRVFAAIALRKAVGRTMGYRHYAGREEQNAAVERWRAWLAAGRPAGWPDGPDLSASAGPATPPDGAAQTREGLP